MKVESANQGLPPSFYREQQLIRLLMIYLATGILFMVLPGTFLGVWNLFAISSAQSTSSVPPEWIQAHGHAQLFGWIGSFILGIGFYSIPNVRRISAWSFWEGWLTWAFWTMGITIRWFSEVYLWHWKILLPLSAVLELAGVVLFLVCSIQGHRSQRKTKGTIEPWMILVIGGTLGLLAAMGLNAFECFKLAAYGSSPAFPPQFDSCFLILSIWGFPLPVAWGFTAHWMPAFLGLRPSRPSLMLIAFAVTVAGILTAFTQALLAASIILLIGSILMVLALRIFEPPEKQAKTQGVHKTFPFFMRMAYVWLLVAGALAVWAAVEPASRGIGGAGRHAITVGFLMTMVFTVGPRILPAFLGRKKLFSEVLMFIALLLTNSGCFFRVSSEIVAYQHNLPWAWFLLPLSATLELAGVIVFTINMLGMFRQPPLLEQKAKAGS